MKTYLFAYSKRGIETAERIAAALDGEKHCYAAEKHACGAFMPVEKPSASLYERAFSSADALIFVSSCGIAVRSVAPFIKNKATDPAVIAVDESGSFVIPLLSGHIGGANTLAKSIASAIGAVPVITTATDVRGRFSADEWAARRGFALSDMSAAKAVSAAILEGDIPLVSDFPIKGELPSGVIFGSSGEVGIAVSYKTAEPFTKTLRLIPKCLFLGIGCRRGTPKELIESAVEAVMDENGLDIRAVKSAASIIIKSDEAGLLEFCREKGLKIDFYSAEELRQVSGDFTQSEFVKSVTGVDNVCERAAMIAADRLLVNKTPISGVTVAVGLKNTEVSFN
ncbi:MAG: cobalt-precorrin 5A hydrolase [Clostridia bacterium]|nr:cobalt-precorrin 5A hydrolase [Clostridia bacterium]